MCTTRYSNFLCIILYTLDKLKALLVPSSLYFRLSRKSSSSLEDSFGFVVEAVQEGGQGDSKATEEQVFTIHYVPG